MSDLGIRRKDDGPVQKGVHDGARRQRGATRPAFIHAFASTLVVIFRRTVT